MMLWAMLWALVGVTVVEEAAVLLAALANLPIR
jgi:hypothetical protein